MENGKVPVLTAQEGLAPQQVPVQIPALLGSVLAGGYDSKDGSLRALDLDVLRQLKVDSEKQHILGILDGRDAESHATVTIPAGSVVNTTLRASLAPKAGEVWYLHCVRIAVPVVGAGGQILVANWRSDVWPDTAATPDADGLPYYAANQGVGAVANFDAEFHAGAPFFDPKGIAVPLRIPYGKKVTLVGLLTVAGTVPAIACDLFLYGYKGKLLVT